VWFNGNAIPNQTLAYFEGCSFDSNHAKLGGALFLAIEPRVAVIMMVSDSKDVGAAPPTICTLQGTAFINNSATGTGGAVGAIFPPDTPSNLHFLNDSCFGAHCNLGTTSFPPNYVQHTARRWRRSVVLNLTDVVFQANSAGTNGGALAAKNGALFMVNVNMTANSATNYGGALYLAGTASLSASQTLWVRNIVEQSSVTSDGQHLYAAAGGGEWNFSGSTVFEHAQVIAAGLSAAKLDGAHGLTIENQDSALTVICPAGAVATVPERWVSMSTAQSGEWRLGPGATTTTTTRAPWNGTAGFSPLPPIVTALNNTQCEAEYFANWKCGNPPPVYPPMIYTAASLGCKQCDRSEVALPAAAGTNSAPATVHSKCESCRWKTSGGATCDSGHVVQTPGWWRPEAGGFVTKDTKFWQCFAHEIACLGSSNNTAGAPAFGAQCDGGHTGPVCSLCKPGYAMHLHRCEECASYAAASVAIAAALFATVAGGSCLLFRWRMRLGIKKKFVTTAKIVVGFYSLLALATETFSIVFPAGFHAILSVLKAAFSSIGDLSVLACALPVNAYGQLLFWCCLLSAVLVGIFWRYRSAVWHVIDVGPATSTGGSWSECVEVAALRTKYSDYSFNAALVLYPFVSRSAGAVFNCREVDTILYLEADYTILCEATDWYWAAAGSTVVCLVYVLGLPVYVAYDVWSGRGSISFCAEGYRTDGGRLALGWEVLEMFRKFLLTLAVIFLHQGSISQVASALVVSVFFLVLHVRVLPFAERTDNWLQGVALTALCILYFVGLVIKAVPGSASSSGLDLLLQVSSIMVGVIAFTVPLFRKIKFWRRGIRKPDHDSCSGLSMSTLHPSEESGSEGYELMRDDGDHALLPAESRGANGQDFTKEKGSVIRSVMQQQNLRDLLRHEQEERRREKEERDIERAAMQEQVRHNEELREELSRSREECIAMQEQLRRVDNRKVAATTADAVVAL
jgi:predicted outer membrane repeat protein